MKRLSPPKLLLLFCISILSCGRHKLNPAEIERNRLFAETLRWTDQRILGEDDFFPKNLKSSAYPEVREWCAIALGRIGNPRALPWLYDAFQSPYAAVRAAAAFAVGETEDREILKEEFRRVDARAAAELVHILDDPSVQVRMRTVEALGKIGLHADAVEIVRRLLSFNYDGSPQRRAYLNLSITALMRLNDPVAFPILEKLAGDKDPEIQWRAANALYRMKAKGARDTFLRLLQNPNTDVRAHAARGLGICENPNLASFLTPLLGPFDAITGKPLPLPVRVYALQALGHLKNPTAVSAIHRALQAAPNISNDPDPMNFAVQAANALGSIGAAEGVAALLPLLKIPGPAANSAVIALAKLLKGREHFFELVDPRQFTTPEATRAWAQAMGELGGGRAIQELMRMLARSADTGASNSDILAVSAVLDSLARTDAPRLQEILVPFLSSRDGVILRAALRGYKPEPGTRSPWAPLLISYAGIAEGRDLEAKIAVLNALEPWIREKDVQESTRAALNDRQRNVRIAAARLLRKAGADDVPWEPGPSERTASQTTYDLVAASRKHRTVAILETVRGPIEIELFREDAPLTVDNFVTLVKRGFFDGLSFMRVVPYFVIQGGDPRNDMEGGPGYTIRCEINMRPFESGSVGMALSGKDTGGSQFFITLAPQPHLDGGYTCFGRVISGMPTVRKMVAGDRILKAWIQEDVAALDDRRY